MEGIIYQNDTVGYFKKLTLNPILGNFTVTNTQIAYEPHGPYQLHQSAIYVPLGEISGTEFSKALGGQKLNLRLANGKKLSFLLKGADEQALQSLRAVLP